jgi:hypothetical protein
MWPLLTRIQATGGREGAEQRSLGETGRPLYPETRGVLDHALTDLDQALPEDR